MEWRLRIDKINLVRDSQQLDGLKTNKSAEIEWMTVENRWLNSEEAYYVQ